MAVISRKKPVFPVSPSLRKYLTKYYREQDIRITYNDLCRYTSAIALHDKNEQDTLWETVFYAPSDMNYLYTELRKIYALLKSAGDISMMDHVHIDRIDLCYYGNTRPFRVRVINVLNDLFDYFYVKVADASRIYGLELEHLLSPNQINFLVHENTLIEEHIAGIPGDQFIRENLQQPLYNEGRLAKEFVKFNERCLVRLLGDMSADNYVIEIIPDFDETYYRLRAIDFDQQCYEGRRAIYMPQFFKCNYPIVAIGLRHMRPELELQYQREERAVLYFRVKLAGEQLDDLLDSLSHDKISSAAKVSQLSYELAGLYNDDAFILCTSMGELLRLSLDMLVKKPVRYKYFYRVKQPKEQLYTMN